MYEKWTHLRLTNCAKFKLIRSINRFYCEVNRNVRKDAEAECASEVIGTALSFRSMVMLRRAQATRSILVQVNAEQSCSELLNFAERTTASKCSRMFHYTTTVQGNACAHYVLMEMSDNAAAEQLLANARHSDPLNVLRLNSPFVWFQMAHPSQAIKTKATTTTTTNETNDERLSKVLVKASSLNAITATELTNELLTADSISHQMEILSRRLQVNELGVRLRFLTALQLEHAMKGIYPHLVACPFGSSVNGLGGCSSDLDLVLVHNDLPSSSSSKTQRLVYQSKSAFADDRLTVQNHIEFIADLLHWFLPGCSQIKRITQARVPIVKFRHELAILDCDISLYNTSCLHMSEALFLLSVLDKRVRELCVTVREWARAVGLTQPAPGRWISNFALTLLVLFFLQQPQALVIPPLRRIRRTSFLMSDKEFQQYRQQILATPSFVSNTTKCNSEQLLLAFFQFYAAFDFAQHGVNLLNGKQVVKPDYSALFIVNPVEPELNVSKNVSVEEIERLRSEMRNAAWTLESSVLMKSEDQEKDHDEDHQPCYSSPGWGLVSLLHQPVGIQNRLTSNSSSLHMPTNRSTSQRLINVKSLFDS